MGSPDVHDEEMPDLGFFDAKDRDIEVNTDTLMAVASPDEGTEGTPKNRKDGDEVVANSCLPPSDNECYASPFEHSQAPVNAKGSRKHLKRKRDGNEAASACKDSEGLVAKCRQELDDLAEYYKKVSSCKLEPDEWSCSSLNSIVACLVEESSLPYSKLVHEMHERLKNREGVTLVSVRSTILFVAQRIPYGVANSDADVLEDDTSSCLWCWETRDMKLFPANRRPTLHIRRTARKKIVERISALSGTITALSSSYDGDNCKKEISRASARLGKSLNATEIQCLIENLKQKNDAHMAEKEAKSREKELIKEQERNKRIAEKEHKRVEFERQKNKLRSERGLKRMEDAEKEDKRREKAEADLKKLLKKQQDEAERELKRREKEEVESKRQMSLQKQATMMERFLKSKIVDNKDKVDDKPDKLENILLLGTSTAVSCLQFDNTPNAATFTMDFAFSQKENFDVMEVRRLHFTRWHKFSCSNISWGIRRSPKIELFKELKLQKSFQEDDVQETSIGSSKGVLGGNVPCSNKGSHDKLEGQCEESGLNDLATSRSTKLSNKKLLQFDKSHRPAYYGTWGKRSDKVGPRHPLTKDLNVDYNVDSDEEWEEEEPGESISDCDKDDEEHPSEDDDSHDSFMVSDGHLSEDEGIQVDNSRVDEAHSLTCSIPEGEAEEVTELLEQQKYLHNLTAQALRKCQPLIILNLLHEKSEPPVAEDLTVTLKMEIMFLKALSMKTCSDNHLIDASFLHDPRDVDQKTCSTEVKGSGSMSVGAEGAIQDADLLELVYSIMLHPYGINKVLASLQQKFPKVPRSHLRSKVREISDFVDNRWQVKKLIFDKLGLSTTPEKLKAKNGTLTTYFSKRCLPPSSTEEPSVP